MRSERLENEDKYLGMFKPEVTEETTVCCCASIKTGNIFVSIILFFCALLYFYGSLSSSKYDSFKQLFKCIIYTIIAGFLLYGTISEKYKYAKVSYILYQIVFVLKIFIYGYSILVNFILIFLRLDWRYIIRVLLLLFFGCVDLGIVCYFIYVMYCLLVIIKDSNNNIYQLLEEDQRLLKDYNQNDQNDKSENDEKDSKDSKENKEQ